MSNSEDTGLDGMDYLIIFGCALLFADAICRIYASADKSYVDSKVRQAKEDMRQKTNERINALEKALRADIKLMADSSKNFFKTEMKKRDKKEQK